MIGRTHSEGRRFGTRRAADPQHTPGRRRGKVLASVAMLTSFAALLGNASAGLNSALALVPRVVNPVLASSTQFDITGFAQAATLDTACVTAASTSLDAQGNPASKHCGGTVTLNGHVIIVPKETIVIMPAAAFTWQELFALAPAPYTGVATGMALNDVPKPLTTYEFQAVGNRVINGAGDRYIAGLVHVSQQDLNGGAGYINYMNYATGEMRVGGVLSDPTTGARVMINDPAITPLQGATAGVLTGRYGRASDQTLQDRRFQVDQDNPTIASASGFPMCFPRTNPALTDDPQCPTAQRPIDTNGTGAYAQLYGTNPPVHKVPDNPLVDTPMPSPYFQAPFEVGDYITYAGTLTADKVGPGTFISAHTIIDNTSISTSPGTDPAYVSIEVGLIGTGGLTVFGAGEAAIRTKFEGMSTDESRPVYLYAVDTNAAGVTTDRYYGAIKPDPGTPVGAVRGRWRFRPPCLSFGNIPTKLDRECVNGPDNGYLPPPREIRAVIAAVGNNAQVDPLVIPAPSNLGPTATAANGLLYGQYHAPIGEYIFPENTPGNPIVENNFNTIPFLTIGGYSSVTGVVAGTLDPWPSDVLPVAGCFKAAPSIGATPLSVASGATVGLSGSSTGTAPVTLLWAASAGTAPSAGTIDFPTIAAPTYTAPTLNPGDPNLTVTVSLTASNACTLVSAAATATFTVTAPAGIPVVNNPAPLSALTGAPVLFTVSGTDPSALPLTFTVTQVGNGAPAVVITTTPVNASSVTVSFTAPATTTFPVLLTVTATNGTNTSAPVTATINVTAPVVADVPTITNVTYRTSKQRLIVTASDTVISPTLVLQLQPYLTIQGNWFDPFNLGNTLTNGLGGLYTMSLVGAPQPAGAGAACVAIAGTPRCPGLTVKSSLGSTSAVHQVDLVRT